jgi:RNA polymerase sigma-70 factor (ECF subfamily)
LARLPREQRDLLPQLRFQNGHRPRKIKESGFCWQSHVGAWFMAERASSPSQPDAGLPPAAPSDRSLLRRLRDGNPDAALQIYLRYAHRLHALARDKCRPALSARLDAEDIVQSVFRNFFRAAQQGCYDVPAGEELWKLLLVIALNNIRDKHAFHESPRRDVRRTLSGDRVDWSADASVSHDEAGYHFLQLVIEETIATLPPPHQQMIEQRLEGHEVADIAKHVGRSKRTVERVLQEFRATLRSALAEDE